MERPRSEPDERAAAGRPSWSRRVGVALLSALALVLLSEFAFDLCAARFGVDREALQRSRRFVADGTCDFEPRPHTVYTRSTGSPGRNSLGFRGPEWTVAKRPGVPRVLCLGSSTTEAGNKAGPLGSYPGQLERGLREELGLEVEVLNAGIAGWTSAEELVAWFLTLQDYAPDLVVIHEAINDVHPRMRAGFRPDYTHWRHAWELPRYGWLQRTLVRWSDLYTWLFVEQPNLDILALTTHSPAAAPAPLAPDSARPYARNVRTIGASAERGGAAVLLLTVPCRVAGNDEHEARSSIVTREHNQLLRELAAENGWMLADAEVELENDAEAQREFSDICHLLPKGNQAKARVVLETLVREWPPARLAAEGRR